jgi:hypothetical protein
MSLMSRANTVILDNEAVQALIDPSHRKHRRLLAAIEAVAARNLRRIGSVRLLVPTAVRAEAGWDRQAPESAVINQLRVGDVALDGAAADIAARARAALGVSIADGHIAAVLGTAPGPHAVVTSDAEDIHRIAGMVGVLPAIVKV